MTTTAFDLTLPPLSRKNRNVIPPKPLLWKRGQQPEAGKSNRPFGGEFYPGLGGNVTLGYARLGEHQQKEFDRGWLTANWQKREGVFTEQRHQIDVTIKDRMANRDALPVQTPGGGSSVTWPTQAIVSTLKTTQ